MTNRDSYSALFHRLELNPPFSAGAAEDGQPPIDFGAGIPDFPVLPTADYTAAFAEVMASPQRYTALSYSAYPGIRELRELVASHRHVPVDNVLITNGAMNGIYLSCAALIDPGDHIAVENPTFPFALKIFRQAQAVIDPIATDADGIDVDAFEARLKAGERFKVLYTIPDFQNPTGSVLPAERKARLVELADRYGFTILSDNPYRDLWFDAEPAEWPQEARELDAGSPLIEVGSFSKLFGPGWRVGWIVTDRERVARLASFRRSVDGHTSGVSQLALATLLGRADGWFDRLLDAERALYAAKAATLTDALTDAFGDRIALRRPQGGYFLWARFAERLDPALPDNARALAAAHVHLVPGDVFHPSDSGTHTARLAFSHLPAETLAEGARRIAEALLGRD